MSFAIKGGGSRVPLKFFKYYFLKTHLESIPAIAKMRFAQSLSFMLWTWMNMAVAGRRSEQPQNVNFEPISRGLKSDIFDCVQV